MLVHIGQPEVAERVHNAWLRTIEDGIHTYDIFTEGVSKQKVGTKEFAEAVVARLGQKPKTLKPVDLRAAPAQQPRPPSADRSVRRQSGTDGRRRLRRLALAQSERAGGRDAEDWRATA